MDLFLGRVLVKNNSDRDELDTEREIMAKLQNRIVLLFFASSKCERCQEFAPTLKEFFKLLMDPFYVERASQLVLITVSLDNTEEQLDKLLNKLPKWSLFLHHDDPYKKELGMKLAVEEIPTVVVLRPDCSILLPNAVQEISESGPECFHHWQEAAEVIDRNFEMHVEFDDKKMRSVTDPIRKLKYKVEKKKKRRWLLGMWGGGGGGGGGGFQNGDADGEEEEDQEDEEQEQHGGDKGGGGGLRGGGGGGKKDNKGFKGLWS